MLAPILKWAPGKNILEKWRPQRDTDYLTHREYLIHQDYLTHQVSIRL